MELYETATESFLQMLVKVVDHIYIRTGYTDMRKQLSGLLDIIQYNFKLDPYGNAVFLFCGRKADRIKAVHYEGYGF